MILVDAEQTQLFGGRVEIDLRVGSAASACSRALLATAPFS
jgi:hypothetical protein